MSIFMPHSYFNINFSAPQPTEETEITSSNRIYFNPMDTEDTAEQLKAFKLSEGFALFKREYEALLDSLNQWCVVQGIQRMLKPSHEDAPIPSFDLFKTRLFDAENYYSIREVLFFNVGKKSLEQLLLLLSNDHIPLESKKNVLLNLQASVGVCADGTSTHIIDAAGDLGAFLGVYSQLENIKRTLIQQQALVFISKKYGQTGGNEIHYANGYYNAVAAQYGLRRKEDVFVKKLQINELLFNSFTNFLETHLTPEMVLHCFMTEINKELMGLRDKLSKHVFAGQAQILFTPELQGRLEKEIEGWNQRYRSLISLDLHALIFLEDTHCSLLPHNKVWVYAKVARGFRALFLTEASQLVPFKINERSQLFYDSGVFWVETADDYLACTPELFANVILPADSDSLTKRTYFVILNQLFKMFSENESLIEMAQKQECADLIKYRCSFILELMLTKGLISYEALIKNKEDVWRLVNAHYFSIVAQLLEKSLITPKLLSAAPSEGPEAGVNSILLLASNQQYALLEQLLAKDLISAEMLSVAASEGPEAGVNSIWLLARYKQFGLLGQLLTKDLISAEILSAAPSEGPDTGKNNIWLLAVNQQFGLLGQLLAKDLISAEMLSAAPSEGPDVGKNNIWVLLLHKQHALLEQLLAKDLISVELLSAAPSEGPEAGVNSILLLAANQQHALLEQLLAKDFISAEMLSAACREGPDAGKNNIWLLAANQQHALLGQLLAKDLISVKMLSAAPSEGPDAGVNSILRLISNEQHALLGQLLAKDLISAEMLSAAPSEGPAAGVNSILLLAANQQHALLEQLLAKDLISAEMLSAAASEGSNAGINSIWLLARYKQFGLLGQLLAKDLISTEMLSAAARDVGDDREVSDAGINSIWLLAFNEQDALLEQLLAKDLISAEMLSATASEGPDAGKNSIWLLVLNKQFGLLGRLLAKDLISAEMLSAAPSKGLDAGKNSVWLVALNKQHDLLGQLLAKDLISAEMLSAAPSQGVYAGRTSIVILTGNKIALLQKLRLITQEPLNAVSKPEERAGITDLVGAMPRGVERGRFFAGTPAKSLHLLLKKCNYSPD